MSPLPTAPPWWLPADLVGLVAAGAIGLCWSFDGTGWAAGLAVGAGVLVGWSLLRPDGAGALLGVLLLALWWLVSGPREWPPTLALAVLLAVFHQAVAVLAAMPPRARLTVRAGWRLLAEVGVVLAAAGTMLGLGLLALRVLSGLAAPAWIAVGLALVSSGVAWLRWTTTRVPARRTSATVAVEEGGQDWFSRG